MTGIILIRLVGGEIFRYFFFIATAQLLSGFIVDVVIGLVVDLQFESTNIFR